MAFGVAHGLECPECGGETHVTQTARANDNAIFVRRRRCKNPDCTFSGITAEDWIPKGLTSMERLDDNARWRRILYDRRRFGYTGQTSGHPRDSDTLKITMKVTHPPDGCLIPEHPHNQLAQAAGNERVPRSPANQPHTNGVRHQDRREGKGLEPDPPAAPEHDLLVVSGEPQ